jgi:hypothetical protein
MKIWKILISFAIIPLCSAIGIARADVLYTLAQGSTFQEGCVGPCLCPVTLPEEVTGTFMLVPAGADPLFTNYHLNDIAWTVLGPNGEIAHKITGQGTYRLGGEVALTQQLILDLDIDGGGSQHLDSGLTPGGSEFPAISIPVSRGTPCFNIWMEIKALSREEDLPIAVLENPIDGQKVSGVLPIYGWALDKKGITTIEFFVDNQWIGNIPYGGTRMDVKEAHPDYPNSENSGFAMIWNYSMLTPGDHSIKVRIHNQDGQFMDLDALVTVKKFHGEFIEKMNPKRRWLYNNSVTAEGVIQKYSIEIEWSNQLQGFEITDVIRK